MSSAHTMKEEEMKIEEEVKKVIISTPSNNPESVESGRRNSLGKVSTKKTPYLSSREKGVEPRYLRSSTGSCHDVCKHGKSHTFTLHQKRFPARRSFPQGNKDKESMESKDSMKLKGIFQTEGNETEQNYLVDMSKYPALEKESIESSSPKEKRIICHEVVQPLAMPENISDGSVNSNDIVAPLDIPDNLSVESVVCHEVIAPINMSEETFDILESLDAEAMKAASVISEAETMKSSARSRTPNSVEKTSKKLVKKSNAVEEKKRVSHSSVLRKAKEKNVEFKGKSIAANKRTQLLAETNKARVLEEKGDHSSIMKPSFTLSPERIGKTTSTPKVTSKKMASTTVKRASVSGSTDESNVRSASTVNRLVPSKPKTSLIKSTSVLVPSRNSTAQYNAKMVVKSVNSSLKPSTFSKSKVQTKGKEIEKPKENVIEKTFHIPERKTPNQKTTKSPKYTPSHSRRSSISSEKKKIVKNPVSSQESKLTSPHKLAFQRGKVVNPKSENNSPRIQKFRQGKGVNESPKNREAKRLVFRTRRTSFGSLKELKNSRLKAPDVVLRHQDVKEEKKAQDLFNVVIEETASKLVETRMSKVKALVGAFETVISLQEKKVPEPPGV